MAGVNRDDSWQCLPLIDYVLRRTASEAETHAETQGQQRSHRLLGSQNGRIKSAITSSLQDSRHVLVSKQEAGINPGDSTKKHKTTRHKFSAPNHESSVEEQELLWHRRRTLALASGGVNGLDEVVPSTTRRLVSNTPSTVICYNDNFSYTYVCRPDPNVAWFESGTFDLEDGTWRNEIAGGTGAVLVGNGLTKVREAGHGTIEAVTALEGTTADTIDFGDVIKTEFTICSVTRYTGDAKGRILNGEGRNWLHGHHKGNAGVAYYDKSITADRNNVEPNTNWVVMCGTNAGSQLKLVNGVDKGTLDGGQGGVELFVNGGGVSENQKSDFAIAEVMVWDRGLTDDEMYAASDYLMSKLEDKNSDFQIAEVMVWDRGLTSDEMYGVCDYLLKKFGIRRTKGIQKIRLQLQGTGYLHVGEVEAFDLNGRNIAKGRTVKESTTESKNPSSAAVDGNPRTHTHTRYEAG